MTGSSRRVGGVCLGQTVHIFPSDDGEILFTFNLTNVTAMQFM